MTRARGALNVEDLLRIILVLVVIWLVLEIVGEAVSTLAGVLGLAQPVLAVVILVLLVLWLLDRI